MKKITISLKFDDSRKKALFGKLLRNRGAFSLLFWGALLIYSFNVIYNKAYIDVNFISREGPSDFVSAYRESMTLEKVIQDIGERSANLESNKDKIYKDPFISAKASGKDAAKVAPGR